ncbi:MAG: isopeptide-forming domain-containing fimbrial protein, partial [Bifidobacterium sp.]|uniref:isopeptide-forming domain-containing fimbrial protein n=1 Tax=Bifidobacterium sp. TaxID=41200 RepID=UPI0039ED2A02
MGMFRMLWSRVGSALSRVAASLTEHHFGHVHYGHAGRSCSPSTRASVVSRGISAVAVLVLSFIIVLSGVLVFSPVERAAADAVELGPDGYFSTLADGALPVVDADDATSTSQDGWANTRRIVFGKTNSSATYQNASVFGGYKTLGFGGSAGIASVPNASTHGTGDERYTSATTSVLANEALLWADDVVTAGFKFDANSLSHHTFDSATGPYKSNLARVSEAVGAQNYSSFEQGLLRAAPVEGVCTRSQSTGCGGGTHTAQTDSVNSYKIFPLSIGDMRKYFGHDSGTAADNNLRCKTNLDNSSNHCANGASASWLRSAVWQYVGLANIIFDTGGPNYNSTDSVTNGIRPAVRLNLDDLLLSADSGSQGQSSTGDLRLTFVSDGASFSLTSSPYLEGDQGVWKLRDVVGASDFSGVAGSGFGWKLVDPLAGDGSVIASGRTNYDAAAGSDGNMVVPCATLTANKDYDLYVWGQLDGSDVSGWTNRATMPVKAVVRTDDAGGCESKVKLPPSYGIDVSGVTDGGLKAYRIGDYGDVVFDHTGALESVKVSTPVSVRSAVASAAGSAGGSNVDGVNPMGWVVARWLGYPSDPLSDDAVSAFDPYAGQLQLFAQSLADDVGSLGPPAGSLPSGTFSSPAAARLSVSGPGLYLIVDDSGESLPIVVGTKAFNESLGDDGVMVDFADAGVDGRHRLGVAELKTSRMDLSKRVVNDAGVDGFDVGAGVEFEVMARVPDLNGHTTAYGSYAFSLSDVAAPGLTLPDVSGVRVSMDVDPGNGLPSPGLDVTPLVGVGVSGQTLTVDGLKALFAQDNGASPVSNSLVPVGALIRVRYVAKVNANASWTDAGGVVESNDNTVTLSRTMQDGSVDSSLSATAHAYSFELDLVKADRGRATEFLPGAEFEADRLASDGSGVQTLQFKQAGDGVYRLAVDGEAGTTQTLVTGLGGRLVVRGVEARMLTLRETKAPDGYFRLPSVMVRAVAVWSNDLSAVQAVSYQTDGSVLASVSQDGSTVMLMDPRVGLASLPYTGSVGIAILLLLG